MDTRARFERESRRDRHDARGPRRDVAQHERTEHRHLRHVQPAQRHGPQRLLDRRLPTGVTAAFSPTSVTTGGSSTLTLSVGSTVAPATYPLTITGTAPSAIHTTSV